MTLSRKCLMALALLGLASAQNVCYGADCAGASDSNVLIQQQVHISEHMHMLDQMQDGQNGFPMDELEERKEKIRHLQSEVNEMVRASTQPNQTNLARIEKMVKKEMIPELVATHDAAQKELDADSQAVSACSRKSTQAQLNIKSVMESKVVSTRKNHTTCRTEEAPKNATQIKTCAELAKWSKEIIPPASLPTEHTPALMGPYLEAMGTYFCPKYDIFMNLDRICTSATKNYTTKREECTTLQLQYEFDFCSWKTKLTDECVFYSKCYTDAVAAYHKKEASTKDLEKKWKTEWTGLHKIACYLNVWTGDKKSTSKGGLVNGEALKACNSSSVDTSPMNIKYPGVPCATPCDITPVQDSPGTQAFVAGYQQFTQTVAAVLPCMEEAPPALTLAEADETLAEDVEADEDAEDDEDEEIEEDVDENVFEAQGDAANAEGIVSAFPCSSHPAPIQIIGKRAGKQLVSYDVKALNVGTGEYTQIYNIPKTRSSPPFQKLNSCGIHPKDSILYCIAKVGAESFLVRVDASKMSFLEGLFSGTKKKSNSGGFDQDGRFYYNTIGEGPKVLFSIGGVDQLTGYSTVASLQQSRTPSPSPAAPAPPPLAKIHFEMKGLRLTGDFVPVTADFEGIGKKTYVLGVMRGGKLLVVRISGNEKKKWVLAADGYETKGVHFYGAGWNFQGRVFFANNKGAGVYEILLNTVDLTKGTVTVQRNCKSQETGSNDGVNCLLVPPPFKAAAPIFKAPMEQKQTMQSQQPACFQESYN